MKRRSSPICLLAFALLLSVACTVGGVLLVSAANDGHDHYDDGQHVPLFAAKIWPRSNPSESYYYEQLPFCKVTAEDDRNSMSLPSQSLGADLSGVRYVPVPYDIVFPHDIVNAQLCTVHLDKDQVESFRSAIDREFVMLMYLDDLPFKVPVGFKPQQQQQRQRQDGSYPSPSLSLYTHMQFTIEYNAQLRQIIEVNVVQDSRTKPAIELAHEQTKDVTFTYSVKWMPTERLFSQRMAKYNNDFALNPAEIEIQWFSILNSLILVVMLIAFLAIIVQRILKRDYEAYASKDIEEDREESGWKLLHADVFRFPRHVNLLSAILGNGVQFLCLYLLFLSLAAVGAFYLHGSYSYSQMYTALIVIYLLTTGISGYVSQKFYLTLGGERWVTNVVVTTLLFVVPMTLVWCLVNIVAISYGSTLALPFKTIAAILGLYFLVSFPLQLVGAITAKNFGSNKFDAPCRTKVVARQIPPQPWWARHGICMVFIAGLLPFAAIYVELHYIFMSVWGNILYTPYPILFIVFCIVIAVTCCMSITMVYLQLSREDHNWWWRSVFYSGSVALFILAYSVYYYYFESNMSGLLQMATYFGVNLMISYGFFLMTAAVGFYSSLTFMKRIFAVLRVD